jgi:YD repeat-containing protein
MLLNGIGKIQLTAVDQSGQTTSTITDVVIAGNAKVGNFSLQFIDLAVPVAGIPIQIVRTYDSRNKSISGDFGFGWSLSYKSTIVQTNGILGDGWTGTVSGGFIPTYCVVAPANFVVSVRLQDGTVYKFAATATADTQCQQLFPPEFVDLTFTPIGTTPPNTKLSAPSATDLFVSGSFPGPISLLDSDTFEDFNPDQFILTLPSGQKLQISQSFGVQSITDLSNNTLTFGVNGITSSTGKAVTFLRDAQNRITTITDPNGHTLKYAYSVAGDLNTFTDPLNNVSTFVYDGAHDLLSFMDPRGIQPLRNVYDDSGRLIQIIDPNGHVINFTQIIGASTQTITDALGDPTTYVYNANGNVISTTDALGDTFSATFDAHGNKLTQDAAGQNTDQYIRCEQQSAYGDRPPRELVYIYLQRFWTTAYN